MKVVLHQHGCEAVDRTLLDVTNRDTIHFGGIPVVCASEIRHILPAVRQGSRYQTMPASWQRSKFLRLINVLHVNESMRTQMQHDCEKSSQKDLHDYAQLLLGVGEGEE